MDKITFEVSNTPNVVIEKLNAGLLSAHLFGRFFSGNINGHSFVIQDKIIRLTEVLPVASTVIYSHIINGSVVAKNSGSEITLEIESKFKRNFLIGLFLGIIILLIQPSLMTVAVFFIPIITIPFLIKYYMESKVTRFFEYALECKVILNKKRVY